MGFIEEQKRQRQRKIETQRALELARRVESEREQERWTSEEARRRALYERAVSKYKESRLSDLISELDSLGRYKSFHESTYGYGNRGDTYVCEMVIASSYGYKKWIEIETDAEGTIRFKGGFLGSSTVSQSSWRCNLVVSIDVLERALGKAYNHPKVRRWEPGPDPSSVSQGPG